MNRAERLLALVLRVFSVPLLCALPCALLPFAWMDVVHRELGLGALPPDPIVHYLARSCSLLYAMHGALLLFASFDVRRYLPLIRFVAALGIAFGVGMVWVDHAAGLPAHWQWMEGAVIIAESGVLLWLVRRAWPTAEAP